MRTSSFSDEEVIALLTKYFVPVWLSVDEYYGLEERGKKELQEFRRIQASAGRHGLEDGDIGVYIIAADGTPVASRGISQVWQVKNLLPWLKEVIEKQRLKPRPSQAISQSAVQPQAPKPKTPGGLLLHVWTCFLEPPANQEPTATGFGEAWVELAPAEWTALAPAAEAGVGSSWKVPRKIADKLYKHFYPPICNYHVDNGKVLESSLTATVSAVSSKESRIVLRGTLQLNHPATDDGQMDGLVTAEVIGAASYDSERRAIRSIQLVTTKASFVTHYKDQASTSQIAVAMELAPAPSETSGSQAKLPHRTEKSTPSR